ncbi:hypothetical protein PGTUg99_020478 [Puccinia graminis f. sp. tritici]|uniref:Uncharacterized protein n=1 Tax=Puccinia graminis f. sp. tritici TaxID=56615 RepID=A0A5B0SM68_PUCGR|nr:hypothetical protein PGTUg99_020478 [Puccinia graminis f. sp. tritici]
MILPDLDAEVLELVKSTQTALHVSNEESDQPSTRQFDHEESSGEEVELPDEVPLPPDGPPQTVLCQGPNPTAGELANGLEGLQNNLGISESEFQTL